MPETISLQKLVNLRDYFSTLEGDVRAHKLREVNAKLIKYLPSQELIIENLDQWTNQAISLLEQVPELQPAVTPIIKLALVHNRAGLITHSIKMTNNPQIGLAILDLADADTPGYDSNLESIRQAMDQKVKQHPQEMLQKLGHMELNPAYAVATLNQLVGRVDHNAIIQTVGQLNKQAAAQRAAMIESDRPNQLERFLRVTGYLFSTLNVAKPGEDVYDTQVLTDEYLNNPETRRVFQVLLTRHFNNHLFVNQDWDTIGDIIAKHDAGDVIYLMQALAYEIGNLAEPHKMSVNNNTQTQMSLVRTNYSRLARANLRQIGDQELTPEQLENVRFIQGELERDNGREGYEYLATAAAQGILPDSEFIAKLISVQSNTENLTDLSVTSLVDTYCFQGSTFDTRLLVKLLTGLVDHFDRPGLNLDSLNQILAQIYSRLLTVPIKINHELSLQGLIDRFQDKNVAINLKYIQSTITGLPI